MAKDYAYYGIVNISLHDLAPLIDAAAELRSMTRSAYIRAVMENEARREIQASTLIRAGKVDNA